MKTRESRLQNGIFVYKKGISLTKQESHLQNGSLALQTGLSGFYLPKVSVNMDDYYQIRDADSKNILLLSAQWFMMFLNRFMVFKTSFRRW